MPSNDYFMRQIEGMTDMLSTLLLDKKASDKEDTVEVTQVSADTQSLLIDLRFLLAQHQINQAENLLFERMEADRETCYLDAALQFYGWLEGLDNQELADCDYTREEIAQRRQMARAFYSRRKKASGPDETD